MRIGDIFKVKTARSSLLIFLFIVIFSISFSYQAFAKVKGACYNCHTMHNSQDGGDVLRTGSGVGWNSSNELDGGSVQGTPAEYLLVTDCVGCHSSTTGKTIIKVGSSKIPIVFNVTTPGPTESILAGGNFYYLEGAGGTEQEADARGHNVRGIDQYDYNLDKAPGGSTVEGIACYNCHLPKHHADDSQIVVDGTGGWYRFLPDVKGIEDSDWEQTKSPYDHNEYKGGRPDTEKSISNFCWGCHPKFYDHAWTGDSSPWQRHPTDEILPGGSTEYAGYTQYSTEAPVARPDFTGYTGPRNTVYPGTDMVMCLSCHRPHASPYPDILRWDYSGMTVGSIAGAGKGCFTCHRNKDGA